MTDLFLLISVIVPACRSGNIFALQSYIAGQNAFEQSSVEVILFNITIAAYDSDSASAGLGYRAAYNKVILGAAVVFPSTADVFSSPSAASDSDGCLDYGWVTAARRPQVSFNNRTP
jgi:hypothetical protein